MQIKNKKLIFYIALVAIAIMLLSTSTRTTIKGNWDISGQVQAYSQYLKETADFDYNYPTILKKAEEIKQSTATPEEAIKKTIQFVAQHVQYSGSISIQYCYNEKASDVMRSKQGDCVSMSRLVTALLRAQGIPARTMGGCLSSIKRCIPLFAMIPYQEAQVTPMQIGDFKKRGYLHEWVEVYDGDKWLRIEATSGQAYILYETCEQYLNYAYDNTPIERCVINDMNFWTQCSAY